jgi:hypothetical protein
MIILLMALCATLIGVGIALIQDPIEEASK